VVFLITAFLASLFPHVEVPEFVPAYGTVVGDSIMELSVPQQLIPGFCRSFQATELEGENGLFVAVPNDSGQMICFYRPTPDAAWQQLTAIGYCDTINRVYSFPALLNIDPQMPSLSMIASKENGSSPFAFFQPLDLDSEDSCSADGIAVTDADLPDTLTAVHHPTLVVPTSAPEDDGRLALSVWDTYSWNSYLFTSDDSGQTFSPDSTSWSSAIPRPDTCSGGPTLISLGPGGELLACILAETNDATHIGLQPYVTSSSDFGETWSEITMLPSEANGSALGGVTGPMPYGSFRGGCPWYGVEIVFQEGTPLIIWRARRAPGDTLTAEERLWPEARAILCSQCIMGQWETVYIGRALGDSSASYDWPDWPTSSVSEDGMLTVLWSDATADSAELDVWAARRDPVSGFWSVPVALTSTAGSEAMLEALPVFSGSSMSILLCDARLLIGESAALRLAELDLLPVLTSEFRTDVIPELSSDAPFPKRHLADIRVFPNPATSSVHLELAPGVELVAAELYDLLGRRVGSRLSEESPMSWSVRTLPRGTYVLRWQSRAAKGSVRVTVVQP
jgi:hypothetical protein